MARSNRFALAVGVQAFLTGGISFMQTLGGKDVSTTLACGVYLFGAASNP